MPLTHIARAVVAEDIIREGSVKPKLCPVFDELLAYFFYGRPAYRVGKEAVVKMEAASPYCFIFSEGVLDKAKNIHAFDTGAYSKRMYSHVLTEDMSLEDFSLGSDRKRINKLVHACFTTKEAYFNGDITHLTKPEDKAAAWEMHARAYLHLLSSPGRNEPDDRICSIEIVVGEPIELEGNLRAVIAPHTHWDGPSKAPFLTALSDSGVEIEPYEFIPGRPPEHYHTNLERSVLSLYRRWGVLS